MNLLCALVGLGLLALFVAITYCLGRFVFVLLADERKHGILGNFFFGLAIWFLAAIAFTAVMASYELGCEVVKHL